MKKITVGELFAGVGAFSLGLERTGYFETKWQVEIDPEARRVLRKHWPDVRRYMDVKKVGAHNLEPVDVIVFGSPCQGLSVSGKGEGLADERSGLFHEAIRICKELRPAVAIWENVPGAFSSNNSKDFLCVLHSFRECGAVDISWRVLNGRYFGVPQRRRRIFLVADFAYHRAGRVLFESPCVPGHTAAGKKKGKSTATRIRSGTGSNSGGRGRVKGHDDTVGPLTACAGTKRKHGHGWGQQEWESGYAVVQLVGVGGADGLARCDTTGQRYDLDTENFVLAPKVAAPLTVDGRPNSNASGHRREDDTNIVAFHATQDPISGPAAPAMGTGNKEGCGSIAVAYTVHSAHSCAKERHTFETDTAKCLDTTGGLASNQGGTVVTQSLCENQRHEFRLSDHTNALTTGGGKPGQGYQAVLISSLVDSTSCNTNNGVQGGVDNATEDQTNAREVLRVLRDQVGEEAFQGWAVGVLEHLQQEEVLLPEVFRQDPGEGTVRSQGGVGGEVARPQKKESGRLRKVWQAAGEGRASQERRPVGQPQGEPGADLPVLPQLQPQQARDLLGAWLRANPQAVRVLREALSEVQETRRSDEVGLARKKTVQPPRLRQDGGRQGAVQPTLHAGEGEGGITAPNQKGGAGVMVLRRLTPL